MDIAALYLSVYAATVAALVLVLAGILPAGEPSL